MYIYVEEEGQGESEKQNDFLNTAYGMQSTYLYIVTLAQCKF